jgi:hypothetical protein
LVWRALLRKEERIDLGRQTQEIEKDGRPYFQDGHRGVSEEAAKYQLRSLITQIT